MAKNSKSLLRGKKINSNHQTLGKESGIVVMTAKNISSVTKIVIGPIKPIRTGKCRIKMKEIPAGMEISVRGSCIVQTLYVYTKEPLVVWEKIEDIYTEKYG